MRDQPGIPEEELDEPLDEGPPQVPPPSGDGPWLFLWQEDLLPFFGISAFVTICLYGWIVVMPHAKGIVGKLLASLLFGGLAALDIKGIRDMLWQVRPRRCPACQHLLERINTAGLLPFTYEPGIAQYRCPTCETVFHNYRT